MENILKQLNLANMKTLTRMYGIPQVILYPICVAAWNLCSQYLQKFTALKAFYTEAFVTDALQAVQDAKQLPTSTQTVAFCKAARINLSAATRQVLANWKVLKGYIIIAFDENIVKSMLEAAGSAYYPKASVDNWGAVTNLIDEANVFITNHLEELTANNNMPPEFQTTFKTVSDNCIELSSIYFTASREKQRTTSQKVDANNAIYMSLMDMLKDGQLIFQDDPATKKMFIYSHLVSIYKKDHSSSLKGYIVDELGRPIENVSVLSLDEKYGAVTNSKGYYKISRVEAGTYTFNITCPGYEPISQSITFVTGTASKGDFAMTAVLEKVA
jgi:hypothetical protein